MQDKSAIKAAGHLPLPQIQSQSDLDIADGPGLVLPTIEIVRFDDANQVASREWRTVDTFFSD